VSGLLIAECASKGFPAANILTETNAPMDPASAALLLDKLSEVIGLDIDTRELRKEGKEIEVKMKGSIERMQKLHENYKQLESNPMYG